MNARIDNLFLVPVLVVALGLMLTGQVMAQTFHSLYFLIQL
jgi:hypothetical protein